MPNKTFKYGIKIMALTDDKNSYFYNIYVFADSDGIGSDSEYRNCSTEFSK